MQCGLISISIKTTINGRTGENMSGKFYSIVMSINYVAYLILVLPFLVLYYFMTNPIRRKNNKRKLNNILKNGGIPRELRKEVIGHYTEFTKIISFSTIAKQRKKPKEEN